MWGRKYAPYGVLFKDQRCNSSLSTDKSDSTGAGGSTKAAWRIAEGMGAEEDGCWVDSLDRGPSFW